MPNNRTSTNVELDWQVEFEVVAFPNTIVIIQQEIIKLMRKEENDKVNKNLTMRKFPTYFSVEFMFVHQQAS